MQKLFNKILVPIDFSQKSKIALDKAVDIATKYSCSIHLLHVVSYSPLTTVALAEGHMAIPFNMIENEKELGYRLESMCEEIKLQARDSVHVSYSVLKGSWDDIIIHLVNENNFDMVLIGQKARTFKKRSMLLNPDLIAEKTNIPVLTVPVNRRLVRLFSIVIPITDFLPVRKLMYGIYIASNDNTVIKLLGVENRQNKDAVQYYLEKASSLIRKNCEVAVDTELIVSDNVAQAVNQYAALQAADLIIVNPNTETKMPGYFSTLLGNIIQKYSSPPVLTVNPI